MLKSSDKLSICKQHFDSWREQSSKMKGRRIIPDALWNEAVSIIPDFTISRVASELGLNPRRLREKQLELSAASLSKQKKKVRKTLKNTNQFIQLDAP